MTDLPSPEPVGEPLHPAVLQLVRTRVLQCSCSIFLFLGFLRPPSANSHHVPLGPGVIYRGNFTSRRRVEKGASGGGVCHLGRSASVRSRGDRPGSSLLGSPVASSRQARGGRPVLSLGKSHVKALSLPAHAIHASSMYLCVPSAALAPASASMRIKEDQQELV